MRILTLAFLLFFNCVYAQVEDAREYFKFSKYSFDLKENEKALDFINKSLVADPSYTNAHLLRAEINTALDNYSAVFPDVNYVLDQREMAASLFAESHLLRGIAHFHLNNFTQAKADLKECLNIDSENAKAYFYRGLISYNSSSTYSALEDLNLAIKNNSNEYEFYYYRAKIKKEHFRPLPGSLEFDQIMADIVHALDLNPEDYKVYMLKCDMLKLNEEHAKEMYVNELSKMIELFPEEADVYAQRGQARMLDSDFSAALVDLNKALDFQPDNEFSLRNRALCFHNLSNYNGAIKDYSASIDLIIKKNPGEMEKSTKYLLAETLVLRGRTFQLTGSRQEACDDFYNAAKLGSKTGLNNYRKSCSIFN